MTSKILNTVNIMKHGTSYSFKCYALDYVLLWKRWKSIRNDNMKISLSHIIICEYINKSMKSNKNRVKITHIKILVFNIMIMMNNIFMLASIASG